MRRSAVRPVSISRRLTIPECHFGRVEHQAEDERVSAPEPPVNPWVRMMRSPLKFSRGARVRRYGSRAPGGSRTRPPQNSAAAKAAAAPAEALELTHRPESALRRLHHEFQFRIYRDVRFSNETRRIDRAVPGLGQAPTKLARFPSPSRVARVSESEKT